MTVESITPKVEYDYAGAGDYTFLFECVDEDHLTLTHISTAGVSTILTLNADYTVTLSVTIGGTCSVTYAATTGTLRIARSTPVTQEVNLVNNNALDMETLESALDRNVLILQEFELRLASALQASTWRGDWATSTEYSLLNLVAAPTGDWYSCVIVHTSGTWSTDLAAGYWELIFPFSDVEDLHTEIETWHGEVDTWQAQVTADKATIDGYKDVAAASAGEASDSADEAAGYAAGLNMPSIGAGDALRLIRVNSGETAFEIGDLIDTTEAVDLTGVGAATLVGEDADSFLVDNFNQATTLTLTLNVGKTVTVAMVDPGVNTVAFAVTGTSIYWQGGEVVEPEATGITLITITRLSSTVSVASYATGYNTVA